MPPLWFRILFAFLMIGAISMAACASKPPYDCKLWMQFDPPEKREYCFPDCPSCGPAFRSDPR